MATERYEAVLFDMDGVLVDTDQSVTTFWQNIAEEYQVSFTDADFQQHVYGCPATHTFDMLFPYLNAHERRTIIAKMADYEMHLSYIAVKGVISFLQILKKYHIPTAIVTSGEQWKIHAVTQQLGIERMFDVQITASDIRQGKPHPDCYLLAARSLHHQPGQCIVFEDSISGVKAAVASGALCIGIRPSNMASPLIQAGAYHVLPDFTWLNLHEDEIKTSLNLLFEAKTPLTLTRKERSH